MIIMECEQCLECINNDIGAYGVDCMISSPPVEIKDRKCSQFQMDYKAKKRQEEKKEKENG